MRNLWLHMLIGSMESSSRESSSLPQFESCERRNETQPSHRVSLPRSAGHVRCNMNLLAGTVVVAFGFFLIGLTGVVFAKPALAERFLMSFASSAQTHYAEQAVRLLVGTSLVVFSPVMWQSSMFRLIGWAIVVSSVGLILVPWQWHHRFGGSVLPMVVRHMKLYAAGSFAFGVLVLYGVFAADLHGAA